MHGFPLRDVVKDVHTRGYWNPWRQSRQRRLLGSSYRSRTDSAWYSGRVELSESNGFKVPPAVPPAAYSTPPPVMRTTYSAPPQTIPTVAYPTHAPAEPVTPTVPPAAPTYIDPAVPPMTPTPAYAAAPGIPPPAYPAMTHRQDFLSLRQNNCTVTEYNAEFNRLARLCPELVAEDRCRMLQFVQGLDGHLQVKIASFRNLSYIEALDKTLMIESAHQRVYPDKKQKQTDWTSGQIQSPQVTGQQQSGRSRPS
ncbi:CASP-like protein 4A1 [Zingiber officinale]|uniref:CASP-like protein 4A1 n=1 Tax=Zingiber officinale TaxID=94328 RepID=UPI001C4BEEA5|nr:CASP-like protein 4A1 [Zingiber officinale]